MYDSVNTLSLPPTAELILAYIDGKYNNYAAVKAKFPNATVIPTTTNAIGSLNAKVYDCEQGDGDAADAADWALHKIALEQRPTIYCSRVGQQGYGWPWVQQELTALNIPLSSVDFGIADYTGTTHLVPGSAFTQYANPPSSGGDYDVSLTNGIWPNSPPTDMLAKPACGIVATPDGKGYYIVAQDGGVFAFGSAPFLDSLPSIGVTPSSPVVGMALYCSPVNVVLGYWLVGSDGGVFALPPGKTPFYGAAN